MENLRITAHLIDGGTQDFEYATGRELIESISHRGDWAAPPSALTIEATADDGRVVTITVPYDDRSRVYVSVSGARGA